MTRYINVNIGYVLVSVHILTLLNKNKKYFQPLTKILRIFFRYNDNSMKRSYVNLSTLGKVPLIYLSL